MGQGSGWLPRVVMVAVALGVASGCMDGQQAEVGLDPGLRVAGGTFMRGPLPGVAGGPEVKAAYLTQTTFRRGIRGKSLSGALGSSAVAVAVGLEHDSGYWIVPAGIPSPDTPDLPSFDAPFDLSPDIQAGAHALTLVAVDEQERFGAAKRVPFRLTEVALPEGELVFSLFWDTNADLDLHLVMPDGTEIYRDEINSWEPPIGVSADPNAWKSGGILDFDSNGDCRIDGRRNENVVFHSAPPVGLYTPRVDAFSLCGATAARWSLEIRWQGELVGSVEGSLGPGDTQFPHGAGAGVKATEFLVRP